MPFFKRYFEVISLTVIVLLGLILRLHQLHTPLADWHSFRQADTVSVTREYVKHGIDLLRPRYHDVSNIQSGFDNPMGWRMVEFPLINGLIAALYSPVNSLYSMEIHVFSRIVSIIFSLPFKS